MDEHAASSPATPDDLTATSYVPQLLGGHLTYSARDIAEMTKTPIERVFRFWIALGFQVALRENLVVCGGSLEAKGNPETKNALDRRIRHLREIAGRIRQMTTEKLRNVACCGQFIRSCRGRSRVLIHRKSLLFGLTQHHISG